MNRPSRADYYTMKLMSLQLSKPPEHLEDLKVKLTYTDERKTFEWTKEGAERATAISKAGWFPRVGLERIRKTGE